MVPDDDYVLTECDLDALRALVVDLETRHDVQVIKAPAMCLTMLRAEDSLEHQEFYLGEALTTECEVQVNGMPGYGVCLGDEPQRGYCLAVVDALRHGGATEGAVDAFLSQHRAVLLDRRSEEFTLVSRTLVDFKLMDQE